MLPIVDLHCDLLSYLSIAKERTPFDAASRSSHPQMQQGGVRLQTLAIFTTTSPASVAEGRDQIASLHKLLQEHSDLYAPYSPSFSLDSSHVHLLYAIENASAICDEKEPLEQMFARLTTLISIIGAPVYISLTWNGENRFGGGIGSSSGLKADGEELLRFLHGKNIAIDLSHSSDLLAYQILNFIDAHCLFLPLLASHSNFRSVTPMERNLPDPLAQEIIQRKGLIGLNLFATFLGTPEHILRHVEHALKLGAERTLCFGADFFCDTDITDASVRYANKAPFFPDYPDASAYPHILHKLKYELGLSLDLLSAISFGNALNFLNFVKK